MKKRLGYFSFNRFPSNHAHMVQIVKMCEAFGNADFEVSLFLCHEEDRSEQIDNEQFLQYRVNRPFDLRWSAWFQDKWRHRWQSFLTTFRQCHNFDVVFTRDFIVAFACMLRRQPCFLEIHQPTFPKIGVVIMRMLVRSGQIKLIAISQELANILAKKFGMPIERFIVEHDAAKPLPEEREIENHDVISYDFDRNKKKIFYIGSFYPGRGLDMIETLASKNPEVDFIAIGGSADWKTRGLNPDNLTNLFLYERVAHRHVARLLVKADVLLMPYGKRVTIEGQGNTAQFCSPLKLFEYLQAGKPIIAPSLPSICEVLRDGENVLLAEPDDEDSWAQALSRLLASHDLAMSISRGARATARYYTWDKRAQRIIHHVSS